LAARLTSAQLRGKITVEIIVVWVVLAVLVGVFAANKGRNGFLGFLLAVILSPVLGFIWVAVLRDKKADARHSELVKAVAVQKTPEADTRPCPRCAETIKRAAVVCRFCQAEVEPMLAASAASPPPVATARAPVAAPPAPPPAPTASVAKSLAFLLVFATVVVGGAVWAVSSSGGAKAVNASLPVAAGDCDRYPAAFAQYRREVRASPEGAKGVSFKMEEVVGSAGSGPMQLMMSFNAPNDRIPHIHYRVRGYADPSTCELQRWEIYEREGSN
jgi:hypothetical protein